MTPRWFCFLIPVVLGLVSLPGCGGLLDPRYSENEEFVYEPHPIGWDDAKGEQKFLAVLKPWSEPKLNTELKKFFGTPREPVVKVSTEAVDINNPHLRLDPATLAKGSEIYRRQCLHCHGLVGDGNGPTGQWLNPRPRDYRRGIFKFRTTTGGRGDSTSPARADLMRTVRKGIPGTAMPSFMWLPEEELQSVVSYVIHLSLRGQVEYRLAEQGDEGDEDVETAVQSRAKLWLQDTQAVLSPAPAPLGGWEKYQQGGEESLKIGQHAFKFGGACAKCHGVDGRANPSTDPQVTVEMQRRDVWGNVNSPRNLTLGMYRGGSRPVDVYYRIKLGIPGSGMPAANTGEGGVTEEELWHLVGYVLSLSQR